MSESAPIPVITVLDSEAGLCEPGSGYCEVPGTGAQTAESVDETELAVRDAGP